MKEPESLSREERSELAKRLRELDIAEAKAVRHATRPAFGAWLKRSRGNRPQVSVAQAVNISRPAYLNYEQGKQSCTVEMFLAFCSFFGADPVEALREILASNPAETP